MNKIFLIICLLVSLSSCINTTGGKIPTDSLGIPNVCGCGAPPSYVTDSQKSGTSMTIEEFNEKSKSW
jgi:hypothetical protein